MAVSGWVRLAVLPLLLGLLIVLWVWTPLGDIAGPRQVASWLAPYRQAWYALPIVTVAYVGLGLAFVPVLLLVAATGIAFGPWLGPLYAMAGCLASASTGFAIGRRAGSRRIRRWGGRRVAKLSELLERNGTLAIFLLRKIPAPFMLANIVAGASRVRFRDFVIGTLLGMGAIVVALAGFGYQATRALDDPQPRSIAIAVAFLSIPLALAWFINRTLRRRLRPADLAVLD